ncbi:MAG: hypothetical protein AAB367_03705 [Patescibacteria group bacterium]
MKRYTKIILFTVGIFFLVLFIVVAISYFLYRCPQGTMRDFNGECKHFLRIENN